jgi:hypothetical protein
MMSEQQKAKVPGTIHRFRNFGEDVYLKFRDHWSVDLGEIDASASHFHVRGIRPRWVKKTMAELRELAALHGFEGGIEINRCD